MVTPHSSFYGVRIIQESDKGVEINVGSLSQLDTCIENCVLLIEQSRLNTGVRPSS